MLTVRILGEFDVKRSATGEPVSFPDETVRRLAKFLILQRGQTATAETLMEVCWPHVDRPARSALHAAISRLRRALEPGLQRGIDSHYVRRRSGGYAFAIERIRLDLAQFEQWAALAERRAAQGDWSGAAEAVSAAESCLAGELLACEPYADWAAPARHALRERRLDVLELGLTAHRHRSDWPAVIRLAQAASAADATREGVYRHLMEAYANIGEHGRALAAYDACRRALAAEIGADPSAATQALYAEILSAHEAGHAAGAAPPAAAARDEARAAPATAARTGLELLHRLALGSVALPLVGRAAMLRDVAHALRDGRLVILSGEPGVGKTRLAAETFNRLAADGAAVFAGTCRSAGHRLPYQPLAEALGPIWPEGSLVRHGLVHLRGTGDDPRRLFAAAINKLLAVSTDRATVLCLDDVHLADTDVISFLHELIPHLGTAHSGDGRLAVLLTARDAELARHDTLWHVLAAARRQGQLTEVEVPRLTAADIEQLVRSRADEDLEKCRALAAHLFAESEGNALFAAERIRYWLDSGIISIRSGLWQWQDRAFHYEPLPVAADLARQRTAGLSPVARQLLHAAVTVGEPVPFAWLAAIVATEPAAALAALDELLERGVFIELRHRGTTVYSIGHRLIADALLRRLPATRRADLHLQAARVLAALAEQDRSVPPLLVADQYRQAGDERLALRWYRQAARAARAAASVAEAASLLQAALDVARQSGATEAVADCCLQLAEVTATAEGYTAAVAALYTEAYESSMTDAERARVCLSWANAVLPTSPDLTLSLAARALTFARSMRDREQTIWAHALQAAAHAGNGDRSAAMRAADAAVAVYNRRPDEHQHAPGTSARPALDVNDPSGISVRHQAVWEATRLMRQIGHVAGEIAGSLYLADVAAVSVYLPDLEVWAERLLAITAADEEEHSFAAFCLSWVAFTKGHHRKGISLLQDIIRAAETYGWPGLLFSARLVLAASLAEAGEAAEAHAVLAPALATADTVGELRAKVLARYIRAFIYWTHGDHAAATHWAEAALAIGEGHLQTMDLIHLRRILGAAQLGLGHWQRALALAEQNMAAARAAGRALDEGLAIGLKGHALALLGDKQTARALLAEAADMLARLGEFTQRAQMLAILASLDEEDTGPA